MLCIMKDEVVCELWELNYLRCYDWDVAVEHVIDELDWLNAI